MTLVANLATQLEERASDEWCRLLDADGTATSITVGQLLERAMAFAATYGSVTGERKLIAVCLYHGLDLHAAFLGAMWAGHLPTMIAPPSPRMEPAKYAASFADMLGHVKPAVVVSDAATIAKLETLSLASFPASRVLDRETVESTGWIAPHLGRAHDLAVLQHSSGTTGLQKGVALTHAAILDHNRVYRERLELRRSDVVCSWLPLYHDMGLIACFLLPLLERLKLVELSPFDWVSRPVSLLEAITQHRGTLCWLPNFAYQFLADSVKSTEGLDLSTIRAFVNSSEPVLDASHRAFVSRFRALGAREDQLTASYAMAENTYAVTQSRPGGYRTLAIDRRVFSDEHRAVATEHDPLVVVSNGAAIEGTEVVVLDDRGQRLADGEVGELALQGPSRFDGYFGREDLTRAAMTDDGFYRTGDLGFIDAGEVFVTGRKKDLIIIQGRNFYPADIERIVGETEGVVAGRVVAFGLRDEHQGTEGLVVLVEAVDQAADAQRRLVLAIRKRIAQSLDCTPSDVRVVPARWLVKSTSGKLARGDNRAKYLATFASPP